MVELQDAILETLYKYHNDHRGSPKMLFTDLYNELCENPSPIQINRVQAELYVLKKSEWVGYDFTASGRGGLVWLEPEGIRVAEELQRSESLKPTYTPVEFQEKRVEQDMEDIRRARMAADISSEIYPTTLEDLARTDEDCARLIHREELLREIKDHLTQTSDRLIVVYGQPLVGKTRLLYYLAETLGDAYMPLIVSGQGLGLSAFNLDDFAFDFAIQLTDKLKKWAKRCGVSVALDAPKWDDFKEGNGRRAFSTHWQHLQQIAGERRLVVLCEEIEHLLDYPEELDPRIPAFLSEFIHSLENGYFILAASERIRFSSNEELSMLVAKGQVVRIPYYDKNAALLVFSALQKYIAYEDGTLQYCVALCDGHPRLLRAVFEAIVSHVTRRPTQQKLGVGDIGPIEKTVIERASDSLWALCQDLSADEVSVVWLISRKVSSPIQGLEYSLVELVSLADQHLGQSTIDLSKGIERLEHREWVEWKNREKGLFRFKLGIFPLWVQRHCLNINLDTMGLVH